MNFVLNLWEGKLGFTKTFWIYYVLVGLALTSINSMIGMTSALSNNMYEVVLINAVIISYMIVALVGVWRSSNLYQGSNLLVSIAKIIVIINFGMQILTLGSLFALGIEYLLIHFAVILLVISVLNSKSNL